ARSQSSHRPGPDRKTAGFERQTGGTGRSGQSRRPNTTQERGDGQRDDAGGDDHPRGALIIAGGVETGGVASLAGRSLQGEEPGHASIAGEKPAATCATRYF